MPGNVTVLTCVDLVLAVTVIWGAGPRAMITAGRETIRRVQVRDERSRGGWRADRSTWAISIYGTISVAVVVAEYAAASAGRLALIVLGYGVSMWLAHGYASVVSGAVQDWSASLYHSWPVAEAAAPALLVTALVAVLGGSNRVAVPLALAACFANLLAVQVAVFHDDGQRPHGRMLATVVLDVLVGIVLLLIMTVLR